MPKVAVRVGDETYHLPEIDEYSLPTVAMVAGFDHTEASMYHRAMIDGLIKSSTIETIWAHQVIASQQQDIDRLMQKLDKIEAIVRRA